MIDTGHGLKQMTPFEKFTMRYAKKSLCITRLRQMFETYAYINMSPEERKDVAKSLMHSSEVSE
jgi:hypothetical protein